MGHHPMGEGVDPNPRFVAEKLVDPSALVMGSTAENLHDRFPQLTKERADALRRRQPGQAAPRPTPTARSSPTWCRSPPARPSTAGAWPPATSRPGPAPPSRTWPRCKTPFRPHGRVTAGNAAGLNDGATACLLAAAEAAEELGLPVKMRLVGYAFAGVEPEVMGVGPIPATEKALAQAGLTHRRHRPVRAQRGVRRAGAGLPRPLRHRRRRPAGQPVRRRDRHRPPAGLLRRAADDPAGPPVRRAPRGPLRPDRHVRRHRHGRHRHLGEPALRRRRDGDSDIDRQPSPTRSSPRPSSGYLDVPGRGQARSR